MERETFETFWWAPPNIMLGERLNTHSIYCANRGSHVWWGKNRFTWSAGLETTACWERTTPVSFQLSPVFVELMTLNGKMCVPFLQKLFPSNHRGGLCFSALSAKESFINNLVCSPALPHIKTSRLSNQGLFHSSLNVLLLYSFFIGQLPNVVIFSH